MDFAMALNSGSGNINKTCWECILKAIIKNYTNTSMEAMHNLWPTQKIAGRVYGSPYGVLYKSEYIFIRNNMESKISNLLIYYTMWNIVPAEILCHVILL